MNLSVASHSVSALSLPASEHGGRNQRSVTGALMNAGNVSSSLSAAAPAPSAQACATSPATPAFTSGKEAYNHLASEALKAVGAANPDALVEDEGASAVKLKEHVVNVFFLGMTSAKNSDSYKDAECMLKKAVSAYAKHGEHGFSSTYRSKNTGGHALHTQLEGKITSLISVNRGVFDVAADLIQNDYLKEGLIQAQAQRLGQGFTLSSQSAADCGNYGNATQPAGSVLAVKLNANAQGKTADHLADFTFAMLSQLELHAGIKEGRRESPLSAQASPDAGPSDTIDGLNSQGMPGGKRPTISGGTASVGDITLNVDNTGLTRPQVEPLASLLSQALDIISQQGKSSGLLLDRLVDRLLSTSNAEQGAMHESVVFKTSSLPHMSSAEQVNVFEEVEVPFVLSSRVESQPVTDFVESAADTEATNSSVNSDSVAQGVVERYESGGRFKVDNLFSDSGNVVPGVDTVDYAGAMGTAHQAFNSELNPSASVSGIKEIDASQPVWTGTFRPSEWDANSLPKNMEVVRRFNILGRDASKSGNKILGEEIARFVPGFSPEGREFRACLVEGKDPSKAEEGTLVKSIFTQIEKDNPRFAGQIKSLFISNDNYETSRTLLHRMNRIITSPGSSTSILGNPTWKR